MPAKKKMKKAAPKSKKTVKKSVKDRRRAAARKKPAQTEAKPIVSSVVPAAPVPVPAEAVAGQFLGTVENYYKKVGVITLTLKDTLAVGDTIRIKGHTTDDLIKVSSLQIDHVPVSSARSGDPVGIKVEKRCRKGDKVYKI